MRYFELQRQSAHFLRKNAIAYITMWPASALWEGGSTCQASLYAGAVMLATWIIWKVLQNHRRINIPARDTSKGHRWQLTDILTHTAYCSICGAIIVDGMYCDSCGVYADHPCFKEADRTLHCKSLSGSGSSMKHHWVKGNLPSNSVCCVCEAECGMQAALTDFRCCWCQRTVHTACVAKMAEICDLGRFKSFIVPPFCLRLKLVGWKGRRHLVVGEVRPPPYRPWCPLIVIANRKSGNNEGDLILRAFRAVLNPAQVIDLCDLPPENGLEWCHLMPKQVCRVLVAGGDGTVAWVLSAIDKLKLDPQPQVCILPLGTGNDLSRVLGWGEGYTGDVEVKPILDQISRAEVARLDRWKVLITPTRHLGIRLPRKEVYMNNYASVGVDALVALKFHRTRESKPYIFCSRLLNKFLYLSYGTKDILDRGCKNLEQKLRLELDGNLVTLPEIEAVIILNIPCWGAGVRPWNMGLGSNNTREQRLDDNVLEVMGIYSSFHIAQLQVGLSEPLRFGQAKVVRLQLLERLPMQVDGEPWEQAPSEIVITHYNQATMLINRRPQ